MVQCVYIYTIYVNFLIVTLGVDYDIQSLWMGEDVASAKQSYNYYC